MMRTTNAMKIGMTFPAHLAVWDTETTSPDPQEARIVTSFIGLMDTASGEFIERWEWLVNPGIEIPKEASDIHGVTTERARAEGMEPAQAMSQMYTRLDALAKDSYCIVVMNAPYDFTVFDRELLRHWPKMRPLMKPNEDGKILYPVVFDPMVFDRAVDKWRKGSRKLVDLARVYGVPVEENAHEAEADCRMAGRVAVKLLGHSRLQDLSLSQVHEKLIATKRNQMIGSDGLAQYWEKMARTTRDPDERADLLARVKNVREVGHYWPMIPRPEDRRNA